MKKLLLLTGLGAASICVALVIFAGRSRTAPLANGGRAAAAREERAALVRSDSQQIAALARDVTQLKAALAERRETEPPAGHDDELPRQSASAEPVAAEPPLSDLEIHARRVASYARSLEAELRDARAASGFESEIMTAVAATSHSSVARAECRSTLCRIEIRHERPEGRDKFSDLLFSTLKYGAYDFPSADGAYTTAYVGMPGHPLPQATIDDLQDVTE